jgi:two-component system, NarL family, nitrate/nitrite response regulator NarL
MTIATVIVDRSSLFRAGLIHTLSGTRFKVRAFKSSLAEVPESLVLRRAPLLLIIALDTQTDEELSHLEQLKRANPELRVLTLSNHFDPDRIVCAIEAGADSCLLRNETPADVLVRTLELVIAGKTVLPEGFAEWVRAGMSLKQANGEISVIAPALETNAIALARIASRPVIPAQLSARELDILDRLTKGASNKMIARDLQVAESTVKVHVKAVLRKIQVQNRTQAAMWAVSHLHPPQSQEGGLNGAA